MEATILVKPVKITRGIIMIKLHRRRCETCNYYELRPNFDDCMKCNHPDFKDDPLMHEIHGFEFDRIERMGCASHSSSLTSDEISSITSAMHYGIPCLCNAVIRPESKKRYDELIKKLKRMEHDYE